VVDALASARPIATSVLRASTVAPPWERIAPPATSKRGWTNPNSGRGVYSTRSALWSGDRAGGVLGTTVTGLVPAPAPGVVEGPL